MVFATLTSKGQMTLPKKVRDDLKLEAGDQVDLVKHGGVYVLMPRNVAIESLAGILGKSPSGSMSDAEHDQAYADALAQEDERIRAGH
jgi:antitoxin PrlF